MATLGASEAHLDARDVFTGAADGRFERVIHHLVTEGGLVPQVIRRDFLAGAFPGHPWIVAVFREGPDVHAEVADLLRAARDVGMEIVLVGGPREAGRDLVDAVPGFTGAGLHAWHVADDGTVHDVAGGGADDRVRPYLSPPDAPPDWERFWRVVIVENERARKEVEGFRDAVSQRPPRATQALVGVIVLVYLYGMTVGAPDLSPALMRMGALERDRVLAGEVWRLLSSAFLHGSVIHLGFNLMVLWSLGSMLERILGSARFLVLWTLAALGGSLLGLALMEGMAVGASGAGWGLMTAELLLTWRGGGILPAGLRARMRQGSMQNLLLNVLISFTPGVAWAAHAGGGLVGAALVLTGAATYGLPRWADPDAERAPDRVPVVMRVGAVLSGMLLVASIAAALAFGRPWELHAPLALERTPLDGGWTADVPRGLARQELAGKPLEGGYEVVFGDVREDAGLLDVVLSPAVTIPTPDERAATLTELEAAFADAGDGFVPDGPLTRAQADGAAVLEGRYTGPGDLRLSRAVVVGDHGVVRADVVWWEQVGGDWPGLARRVALSARPD